MPNYGAIHRWRNLFLLSHYMKIKCSYRHLNMFLVISTASEDITDRNSYLFTTCLILLLCIISLWRYSIKPAKYGRFSSFGSLRSQRNKTQIVKKYISRLLGSVIVNFETLPHVLLQAILGHFKRPKMSSLNRDKWDTNDRFVSIKQVQLYIPIARKVLFVTFLLGSCPKSAECLLWTFLTVNLFPF